MLSKFSAKFISWLGTTGTRQERNERRVAEQEDKNKYLSKEEVNHADIT